MPAPVKAPIIAVVGPSGVGKDSVMHALAARDDGFRLMQRVITRDAAAGGEDCETASVSEFLRREDNGEFVLSWRAHGLHYGIPSSIREIRASARAVLVNLSRSVLLEAQERLDPFVVLSLTADPELLARRLASRGREDVADQARRLTRASVNLPEGLRTVVEIDNSGAMDDTVAAVLLRLQPVSE